MELSVTWSMGHQNPDYNRKFTAKRTSLQGRWELISTGGGLALAEKTAAVMHRLFSYLTFCMQADVTGDIISCAKFTWLTTWAKLSEALQIIGKPLSIHTWLLLYFKQINNQVLCFWGLLAQLWAAVNKLNTWCTPVNVASLLMLDLFSLMILHFSTV